MVSVATRFASPRHPPERDTARAMSQENVERAYRAFDAFNRRDLDAFLAGCDRDVEVHSRLAELEGAQALEAAALRE